MHMIGKLFAKMARIFFQKLKAWMNWFYTVRGIYEIIYALYLCPVTGKLFKEK